MAMVAYVANSCALDIPLKRVRECELSMPVAFASPESLPIGLAALPKLRHAAMATGVDVVMP